MAEPILDFFAMFGPIPPAGATPGTDALRAVHARHGVSGAVALSTRGIYHSAPAGNRETAKLCSDSGGTLLPAAVLDPRLPTLDTSHQGARALALFPATQRWPVRLASLQILLKSLADARLATPLMLEAVRPGDATALFDMASAAGYAGPLVLTGIDEPTLAEAIALSKLSERIFVSTDGLRGIGSIALAVNLLGAERVLFGSGATARNALGAALAIVRSSGLDSGTMTQIFSGNARRILAAGGSA